MWWPQVIVAALGVWLMASPAILDYAGAARMNDRIVGPVIASLAVVAAWEVTRPLRWLNIPFGLWLLVAPWLLGYEGEATANSCVAGLLILLFTPWGGGATKQFGGGWSVLWRSSPHQGEPRVQVRG